MRECLAEGAFGQKDALLKDDLKAAEGAVAKRMPSSTNVWAKERPVQRQP